jgi:hypothetical protein
MTGMPDEHGQRLMAWAAYPLHGAGKVGQPVQADLQRAARTFGTQAAAFRSILPARGPADVDGGSSELDQALTQILELIGGHGHPTGGDDRPARPRPPAGLRRPSGAVMTRQRSASPLATSAECWVDGDIDGLQALAGVLYSHAFQITDVMAVLEQQVSRLTGRGWPAGSMVASSWRRASATAEALAAVIVQTAAIVDGLAAELAMIQNALEEEAYVASRYGVKIGTDGQPPPVPAGPQADLSERHWLVAYKLAHERAMADAQQARCQAARQLAHLYEQIKPRRPLAMSPAVPEILASFLRGPQALSRADRRSVVKDV